MSSPSPRSTLAVLAAGFFIVVALGGATLSSDSQTYLEGRAFRPPLYPLFLQAAQGLFGSYWLRVVPLLQGAAVLAGVLFLARVLGRHLKLGAAAAGAVFVVLAAPLLPLPLDEWRIANNVLSEALSYAALLFAAAFLANGVLSGRRTAGPAGFASMAALGTLVRPQMLFTYPVAALLIGWDLFRWRDAKRAGRLALAALLAAAAAAGATRLWQQPHRAEGASLLALQFCTAALYVSDPSDALAFDDPRDRALAESVGRAMGEGGLYASFRRGRNLSLAAHYTSVYNEILWGTLYPAASPTGDVREAEAAAGRLAPVLLRRRAAEYLRLVASVALEKITLHRLLLWLGLLAAVVPALRDGRRVLLAAGVLLGLSNHLLVSLLEPLLTRYSFYTDHLLAALLLAVVAAPAEDRAG